MSIVVKIKAILFTSLFLLCAFAPLPAVASAPVEVLGLFKDRAVLRMPSGSETLVRVGQTKEGATLLAATSQQAKVRYQGETYKLGLSRNPRGGYKQAKLSKISLNPDHQGQYRVVGEINDSSVRFLVDTGATVVALSSNQAEALGIDYRAGKPGRVQTAQGVASSYFVELAEVSVGDVQAQNVRAAVINGAYPRDVLLGMSFLRQVKMEQDGGVLSLSKKL